MSAWKNLKRYFIADLSIARDPFSLGSWDRPVDDAPSAKAEGKKKLPSAYQGDMAGQMLSADLKTNVDWISRRFSLPESQGLLIHQITLPVEPPVDAAIVYIPGIVDSVRLTRSVLGPLLEEEQTGPVTPTPRDLFRQVVQEGQGTIRQEWAQAVNDLLDGSAIVLVDGENRCISVRMEGWTKRDVDRPQSEITVRGPQEAFTEDLRNSISQIRKRLRTPDLMIELGRLGRYSRTDFAMVYLKGVANPDLVAEIRRRIAAIKVDYIADSGSLEQFIEDHPFSVFPTIISTERPDRVAAQVAEGYVGVMIDNDPNALILPTTIPTLMHSAEDIYLRWPSGTFMRLTRVLSYYVSLTLPGLYVALANYRQEMIPTPLLLAIAHSRETVPFSAVMEVLLMEGAFELIHEATLRVPTVIGPTIGIVGSLILGQAAVQAGVISPILVIITATTALASFAIPNYELQMAVRIWRFSYILAAAVLGLDGVVMLHTAYVAYLCSINSFGAPYLAPLTPPKSQRDAIWRAPIYMQEQRPELVRPQRSRRQVPVTRPWWPKAPAPQEGDSNDDG